MSKLWNRMNLTMNASLLKEKNIKNIEIQSK